MIHYICAGGCGAVVEKPGVCQAMACSKHGQSLEQCDCVDNQHFGKMKKSDSVSVDASVQQTSEKKWWQIWK